MPQFRRIQQDEYVHGGELIFELVWGGNQMALLYYFLTGLL